MIVDTMGFRMNLCCVLMGVYRGIGKEGLMRQRYILRFIRSLFHEQIGRMN